MHALARNKTFKRADVFSSWYLYGTVSSLQHTKDCINGFNLKLLKISCSCPARMTDGFSALQRLGKMERQRNIITM